jgi:hypothetical protein
MYKLPLAAMLIAAYLAFLLLRYKCRQHHGCGSNRLEQPSRTKLIILIVLGSGSILAPLVSYRAAWTVLIPIGIVVVLAQEGIYMFFGE